MRRMVINYCCAYRRQNQEVTGFKCNKGGLNSMLGGSFKLSIETEYL